MTDEETVAPPEWLLVGLIIILVLVLGGCRRPVPPPASPAPQPGCMPSPPPRERDVILTGPPECPATFVACIDVEAALALEHNVRNLRRYTDEAWARCGALPDGGSDATGPVPLP